MNYIPMTKNCISMNKNCIMYSSSFVPVVNKVEEEVKTEIVEPNLLEGSGMMRNKNPSVRKLNKFINLKI